MKNVNEKAVSIEWLTDELKLGVREIFEPRYKRILTDNEVVEIAENLIDVLEVFYKFKYEQQYEKQNENQNPS